MIQIDSSLKKIILDKLAELTSSFKSGKSDNQALGIDIGSSSIKVVQIKKKGGKAVLETYGIISTGPYNNSEIGASAVLSSDNLSKAILDLMRESNVTTKSCAISIPSLSSLIFTISFPSDIKEDQLDKVVPIEARKYIPVPIGEVTLDWSVIPKEIEEVGGEESKKEESLEVLVVAIHNDVLTQYRDVISKTGLSCDSFEMEIFSNIRSSFDNDLAPVMLIDFGSSKTKVSIIEAGIVRVFHVVNRGAQDITRNISQSLGVPFSEAEKLKRDIGLDFSLDPKVGKICRASIDYVFSDINSIVFAYEKKYNKSISKIFLSGGGSMLRGLFEGAKENFKIQVVYSNPFAKTEFPAFLEPVLTASGPEFAVAVGLALRKLS